MELRVYQSDSIRVVSDHAKQNFVDIRTMGSEEIIVDTYERFHYIEIRRKEGVQRVFLFKKKSDKKDYDFGFFEDAEVVYSCNEVKR